MENNNQNYYEPSVPFDFDQIYSNEEQDEPIDYLKESVVLNELLNFIAPPRFKKNATICRLYAILFICRPWYFGDENITQVEVAEQLGVSKSVFNAHVSEFKKRFGFHVSGMRNPDALKKFSAICKERADELAEARRKARKNNGG